MNILLAAALPICTILGAIGTYLITRTRVEATCDADTQRVARERDEARKQLRLVTADRDYWQAYAENATRLPDPGEGFDTARMFREVTGQFPINPAPDLSFTGSWTRAEAQKIQAETQATK